MDEQQHGLSEQVEGAQPQARPGEGAFHTRYLRTTDKSPSFDTSSADYLTSGPEQVEGAQPQARPGEGAVHTRYLQTAAMQLGGPHAVCQHDLRYPVHLHGRRVQASGPEQVEGAQPQASPGEGAFHTRYLQTAFPSDKNIGRTLPRFSSREAL